MRLAFPLIAALTFPMLGLDVACSPQYPAEAADSSRTAAPRVDTSARVLVPRPRPEARSGVLPPGVPDPWSRATLVIPVAGVRPGDLADTFTDARSEGRVHNAIDVMAPRGTPVVAAGAGRVARLFTSERGGLTVYVLLPDERTVHYYAHLDAYAPGLADGQMLRAGDAIGTVGETGNVAPGNAHLHFAIWITPVAGGSFWTGESVNPYPLLRRAEPASAP